MTAGVEGALAGIVVADFSRVLAAPYATMLFGDLGADVIKVERPGVGDDTRAWGPPFAGDEATYFLSVNRNKRSFTADLSDEADRDELAKLIRRADVLIENFRPGTMSRHGLSYEQVRELNPRLVYCSITGFGAGKGAILSGYDLLVQAVGGLMSVTGAGPGEPVKAGVAMVDVLTGLHAAVGVLAALRAREITGRGQLVEVNLLGTLLSSMVNQSAGYTAAGAVPGILGNRHPSIAPYQLFPAADRPVVVAVGNDRQFAALCSGLDVPELAEDPRFATNPDRVAHIDALDEIVSARMATRTADYWSPPTGGDRPDSASTPTNCAPGSRDRCPSPAWPIRVLPLHQFRPTGATHDRPRVRLPRPRLAVHPGGVGSAGPRPRVRRRADPSAHR